MVRCVVASPKNGVVKVRFHEVMCCINVLQTICVIVAFGLRVKEHQQDHVHYTYCNRQYKQDFADCVGSMPRQKKQNVGNDMKQSGNQSPYHILSVFDTRVSIDTRVPCS